MLVITSIYSWKYHVWFSLTILLSWVAWIVAYLTHMNLPQPWFHIIQLCKKKQLLIMVKRLTMANIWLISSSLTSWSVMFTALLGQYMYQLRAWWCDWVWSSTFLCGRECRLSQSHTCFSTTTGHIPSFSPSLSVSVSLPLSVSFSHTLPKKSISRVRHNVSTAFDSSIWHNVSTAWESRLKHNVRMACDNRVQHNVSTSCDSRVWHSVIIACDRRVWHYVSMAFDNWVRHSVSIAWVSRIWHNVSKAYDSRERHNVSM